MSARRTPGLPALALDRASATPLYRQIYEGYRAAILDRRLRPGQRMPSTRGLAEELGLSRIPVLNAFEQLIAEGYLEAKTGAGTYVSNTLPLQKTEREPSEESTGATTATTAGVRSRHRRVSSVSSQLSPRLAWFGPGAFSMGQASSEEFPIATWTRLVAKQARKITPKMLRYSPSFGYEPFREAVADYLRTTRAMHCEADQIMVVSGSQQGLAVATRALLDPGDEAWIEEPGYHGAQSALALAGAQAIPVATDDEGLRVEDGITRAPRARVAMVTPTHQYPLGVTMSASRRVQLLNWASGRGSWIIEDDYDSEYRYESLPLGALQGIDRDARVIYVGTFSKVLFPSLRIGYLVVPRDLIDQFANVRRAMDISPPVFLQAVLNDFLREGHFALHIRRMRRRYRACREALVEAIHATFGDEFRVLGDQAGMHLVVELPPGIDDRAVAMAAAATELYVMPLSWCYLGRSAKRGLVLGFGGVRLSEIRAGVKALETVIREVRASRSVA